MKKHFNYFSKKIIILLALCLVLPAGSAWSEDATILPVTTGTIIRNDARITFEWPKAVGFMANANGKTLKVTFGRKANPDFGPLLSSLYPYVTSARRERDGKTIILTLDKPYRIRTFISDNIGGIDILNIDPKKRLALQQNTEVAALAPAAGSEPAAVTPAATPLPTPTPPTTAAPAPLPAAPAPEMAATPPAPPATPPVPAPIPAPETAAAPTPPAPAPASTAPNDSSVLAITGGAPEPEPPAPPPGSPVKVNVSASEASAVLRFPFNERVAAAAFVRTGYLWVVFNKPVALDLADFDVMSKTVIGKGEIISSKQVTVLRVPVDDNILASLAKEDRSFEWAVLLTAKKRPLTNPLKIEVNTDPPAPPHVFINSLEMAEPVTIQDPQIGDEMVVVPLFKTGEGVAIKRDFIEFSLFTTAQGVVISKKADDVTVTPLRNGMRISLPQGASLTPGLPEPTESTAAESLQSVATLFPFERWKPDTLVPRRVQIRNLFHATVEKATVQEQNDARLRLAQIFLSEGMAPEAAGLLDGINRTDPPFYRSSKLAAMRGAANFLMYRFADAARDFSASELNNNKETNYWRNMISDLLGTPGQFDYLDMNPDYISKYPPLFRQRLAIVAADRSIDDKAYNTALKIFDTLHQENQENLVAPINTYVNFLMAKISADTGQEEEAMESLEKLAKDLSHPFVQSRAEFSLIAWAMDHNTLSKDEIIDRLERLRLGWHGDSLELKVLSLLGDLYSEKKDYVNAMRIWDNGVNCFPSTGTAIEMSRRMEETFIIMFNEGTADSLPTMDALALYYQYRNYAPPGSTGRAMVEKLADRLVAVDLLDQAALLLDHQMHFQSEKEQRSLLGTKVATIHLLNHQPKKALQALQDSVYGENAVLLRLLRNRLAAHAHADLGQSDKALQILGQDDSPDAERIRLDIYWQKKDWPKVIASVEAMLRNRKDPAAPIDIDESEYVLELALAYVFQNNATQLQYLHDYYGPLMANNPNRAVFEFITAADTPLTPTNFDDVIKRLSETSKFIENYSARIQTAGLTPTIKKDTVTK